MGTDAAQIPAGTEGDVGAVELAATKSSPVLAVNHGIGHDEREVSAGLEVALDGAGDEEAGEVLMGSSGFVVPEAAVSSQRFEPSLHGGGHVPVGQPRRVTDENVDAILIASEPGGAGRVSDVVAPNVVAAGLVQLFEPGEVGVEGGQVGGIERQAAHGALTEPVGCLTRGPTGLIDECLHQIVEAGAVGQQVVGEAQLPGQQLITGVSRNHQVIDGEQILTLIPAQRVSEVNRH